jgi:kynurenine formamidase
MPKEIYNKGDLIHSKDGDFECLLKVIANGHNDQYAVKVFACNSEDYLLLGIEGMFVITTVGWAKVRAQDLALYTHWPQHTKEFWDLLNET